MYYRAGGFLRPTPALDPRCLARLGVPRDAGGRRAAPASSKDKDKGAAGDADDDDDDIEPAALAMSACLQLFLRRLLAAAESCVGDGDDGGGGGGAPPPPSPRASRQRVGAASLRRAGSGRGWRDAQAGEATRAGTPAGECEALTRRSPATCTRTSRASTPT